MSLVRAYCFRDITKRLSNVDWLFIAQYTYKHKLFVLNKTILSRFQIRYKKECKNKNILNKKYMFHNLTVWMNTCINHCYIKLFLNKDRRFEWSKQNTFKKIARIFVHEKPVALTLHCFDQSVLYCWYINRWELYQSIGIKLFFLENVYFCIVLYTRLRDIRQVHGLFKCPS